jgi:hypothetical protein
MKARFIALAVFAVLAVGGGALGYYLIGRNTEREVDFVVELALEEAGLDFARKAAFTRSDGTAWLEALYTKPEQAERLNRGVSALVARWSRELPRLQRQLFPAAPIDENRLAAEIDERFNAGAFAYMTERRELQRQALIAAERDQRTLEENAQRLAQQDMRAVTNFFDQYHRYPALGSRIENGYVVEP